MSDISAPIVAAPASYVTEHVVAFGAPGTPSTPVDADHPLPTRTMLGASERPPLAGTADASIVVGPYVPELVRPIHLSLSGTWSGSAQLLRSTDGGATCLPLTVAGDPWALFGGNCNEPVAEESDAAASYYLAITLASGSITYRVSQ